MKATTRKVASLISVAVMLAACTTASRPDPVLVKTELVKTVTVQEAKKEVHVIPVPQIVTPKPVAIENKTEVTPVDKPIAVARIKTIAPTIKPVVSKPNPKPVTKPIVVINNANNKPIAILVKNEDVMAVEPPKPNAALPAIPPNAIPLIPILRKYLDLLWPKVPARSYIAAKIEQETCLSLKHKGCWSSHTELKTKREYGFGLGQITIAYRADGSERFNVWKDLIKIDPVLKEKWTWENRYDSELQIRALIVKSKMSVDSIRFDTANSTEHLAFGFVTYNSGSVLIDRRLCFDVKGCDPSKWYGNVELYSSKAKVAQPGYGKSFYEISREYPKNIMFVRRPKYIPYLDN